MKNTEMARMLRIAASCLESAMDSLPDCIAGTESAESALVIASNIVNPAIQAASAALEIQEIKSENEVLPSLQLVMIYVAQQANERAKEISQSVIMLEGISVNG